MSFEQILFYAFSGFLVFSALIVVGSRNPVFSALALVLAFFSAAGLWMLLEAEFLAIVLVLVYVGAVMVLFLFVVMMLDINFDTLKQGFAGYFPVGAAIGLVLMAEMYMVLGPDNFGLEQVPAPPRAEASYNNTEELGSVLYTVYLYPFEIAAVILLVGIIAAIVLTMRRREGTRTQDPSEQVRVKKADRLSVVKMEAEKD